MITTVGDLHRKLGVFIAADAYRSEMQVRDGNKRPFLSMEVNTIDGLAMLVLDSAGVRIDPSLTLPHYDPNIKR